MKPEGASASQSAALVEPERRAAGAPAHLKRGDVGVLERSQALEHDRAHAFPQMEDLAGAAEICADPLPRQHLAGRHDHRLLMVGIKMGLDRIADDDDGAILEARSRRAVNLVDVGHLDASLRLRPRLPLRMELPQFIDELAAERIARAEAADLGVGPRALINPIFEALELVEVGARRARQSGDRRKSERVQRPCQRRERQDAKAGKAYERGARREREGEHQRGGDRRGDRRGDEIEMMDIGRLDAQEERCGDA